MIVYKLLIDSDMYCKEIAAVAGLYVSVKAAQKAVQQLVDCQPVDWNYGEGCIWANSCYVCEFYFFCTIVEVEVKE
jgi:hypothetical protein